METVKNGKEKQLAYTRNMEMLKKALNLGFYLEAISITYAIMEDRLISFLHYAGIVTRNKDNLKVSRRIYPYVRELLLIADEDPIKIKDISIKLKVVNAFMEMSTEKAQEIDAKIIQKANNKEIKTKPLFDYMTSIDNQINKTIDRKYIIQLIKDIDSWRNDRNQLIHALLNKTIETSETAKKECAVNGQNMVRALDNNLSKKFKKNNPIRKKFNIN